MKKYLMIFAAALAAISIASCKKDNPDTGDGGTDNGGTNPPAGTTLPASLSGSDYYVIALGSEEYALLEENDKVKLNLQPYNVDDNPDKPGIALNFWTYNYGAGDQPTYSEATPEGTNFYGFTSTWVCATVTAGGWSGAAYIITEDGVIDRTDLDLMKDLAQGDYYLHIGYKSDKPDVCQLITLNWGKEGAADATKYAFAIGEGTIDESDASGAFVKTHTAMKPVDGEFNVGEWEEYEIKLSDTGINYNIEPASSNFFQFSSGGVQGTKIQLDAVFFYKK